jgi:glyoxylase-like metal-dependent hydrolase (beta-lactamase superfamily II)
MIVNFFSAGPLETNTVLLACPKTQKAAIIDVPFESTPILMEEIKKSFLKPQMILLTHSHWDHIGEAIELKEKLKIPIYVHAEDAGNLEAPGSDGLPLFFPIKAGAADHILKDGQILELGSLKIEVIHTPGHTPGGVCFWIENEGILISGDTLFQGTIGKLTLPTGRPRLMWESLKKLSQLPPYTRVIPGHGEETTIGAETWLSNPQKKFGG